ncbi:MAG TPA: TSUP family transporter [Methylomirabilota bacterium]
MATAVLRRLTHGGLALDGRSVAAIGRHLFLPFLGLLAGSVSAFLGVGGGVIIVPLLVWILRMPVKQATGVSLASVVLISLVGTVTETIVHAANVRWTTALWLTGGSLLGSWLGGRLLRVLNDRPLRVGLAAILLLATWRMLTTISTASTLKPALVADPMPMLVVAIGLVAGAISVLFGVGGGVVIVPAFLLLFPEMPFTMVAATSLAAVVPTSAFSAYQHVRMGTVNGGMVVRLSAFGIVGAVLGALAVNTVPVLAFRAVCAAFLILAAVRMVVTSKKAGAEGQAAPKPWALPGVPAGLAWLPVPVRAVAPSAHRSDAAPRGDGVA